MRASDFPREWKAMLLAMDNDNYDKVEKLAKKYHFDRDAGGRPLTKRREGRGLESPYLYHWKSPDGREGVAHSTVEMAKVIGLHRSSITGRFLDAGTDIVRWNNGKKKGWIVERSFKE